MARDLNNLAQLLRATNRLAEAEPLMRRVCGILVAFTRATGHPHPHLDAAFSNYRALLKALAWSEPEIDALFAELLAPVASVLTPRGGRWPSPSRIGPRLLMT